MSPQMSPQASPGTGPRRTARPEPPRTMTKAGLHFLQALAAQHRAGCYLEIGPLFGSSTRAIDAGRTDPAIPIHTIDTFEPAPWVRKRLGRDLSRAAFDGFTADIPALTVHQGFAPDVVRQSWRAPIGFYFDDATHGDPGWSDNFSFFSPFFTEDAIVCGDDFAGGWPDIVRNVYDITDRLGVRLFVVGRVWAFAMQDEARIENAVHAAFPRLKGAEFEVRHGAAAHRNHAASWSWGLHRPDALSEVRLLGRRRPEIGVRLTRHDGSETHARLGREPVVLEQVAGLSLDVPRGLALQFCIRDGRGKTSNTKDLTGTCGLDLPAGGAITALRLSHR